MIGETLAGVGLLLNTYKAISGGNNDPQNVAAEIVKELKSNKKIPVTLSGGSMIKFINKYIVEPTAIISSELKQEEITEKLLELEADIFASFYMQVFDILNKVNGIDGTVAIELLSTNYTNISSVGKNVKEMMSNESYDFVNDLLVNDNFSLSFEDKSNRDRSKVADNELAKSIPSTIQRELNLNMRINNGNGNAFNVVIPVLVKLNIVYVSPTSILNAMETKTSDNNFTNRLDEYRSGAISLAELLTASDLIKKYKDNKIKDNENLIKLIDDKAMSANLKVVQHGAVGFEKYYNFLIITEEDKIAIEKKLHGKISKDKYKEELLKQFKCLMVTVVDRDYERVIIRIKDLASTTDLTFKALSKRKSDKNDFSEIYKALLSGRPPVL